MRVQRRAFTLIELLIVISIIAVLMLILSPLLRAIRATARRTVCQHNYQQMFAAMLDYSEDYRGRLPYATVLNRPPSYWRQLHNIRTAYVELGYKLFHGPADTGREGRGVYFDYFGSSYQNRADMTNAHGRGLTPEQYMPFAWQQTDYCPKPSRLAIIRDGLGWHRLGKGVAIGSTRGEQFVFLDGHVEYNPNESWWGYGGNIW